MKQINDCLDRAFSGKHPLLGSKWKAIITDTKLLYLFHYQHHALTYHIEECKFVYLWEGETNADKRGINAALNYLLKKEKRDEQTELG